MAYSGELQGSDVLLRDVPWETYMTARLISDRDLQLIRRYDKKDDKSKGSLLQEVFHQPPMQIFHSPGLSQDDRNLVLRMALHILRLS